MIHSIALFILSFVGSIYLLNVACFMGSTHVAEEFKIRVVVMAFLIGLGLALL